MKKTLISTAIAAAMFTGVSAQAATTGPDLYGEVNLSGEYVSDSFDADTGVDESEKSMVSRDTFLGVKGAQGLDHHGMDLVYDVQVGFDYNSASSDEDFELRKADIGVATDMFSIHAGRLENPYVSISEKRDLFANTLASSKSVFQINNAEHLDNTLAAYVTPTQELTLAASYTHETDEDVELVNPMEFEFDSYSLTAQYDLGMASVYGGYSKVDFATTLNDVEFYKLGTEVNPAENVTVNLTGERVETDLESYTNYLAQVGYGVTSDVVLKGQVAYIDDTSFTESGNMYAVGADYKLGENTSLNATYADIDTDTGHNLAGYNTAGSTSNDGFSVGISHKF